MESIWNFGISGCFVDNEISWMRGREDDFLALLSPRALAAIPAAEWRSCARFGRGSKAEEPQVIGKMGVWVIVTARTKVKLWMSQKIKLLVFKVGN